MEKLLKDNAGLIWLNVRCFSGLCAYNRACDVEDLEQAARIGIMKAHSTYDPGAGMAWSTWASFAMRAEIRRALGLRAGAELPRVLSLDVPAYADDPEGETMVDTLPDDSIEPFDVAPYREHVQERVRAAMAELPENAAKALELTQLDGLSRKQAAAALGVEMDELARLIAKGKRVLFNNKELRALALEEMTPYYKHKGVSAFLSSGSSAVEDIVMQRERMRRAIRQ